VKGFKIIDRGIFLDTTRFIEIPLTPVRLITT
jgi:hypothetical protein